MAMVMVGLVRMVMVKRMVVMMGVMVIVMFMGV